MKTLFGVVVLLSITGLCLFGLSLLLGDKFGEFCLVFLALSVGLAPLALIAAVAAKL